MSAHKHIDKICCVILAVVLVIAVVFINSESLGVTIQERTLGYETKLFDTSRVHTIDIVMDDWDSFLETCESEEYSLCSVVIDNEAYKNVAIRGKGNTSLTQVSSYGNDRYSFKIEFDHYDSTSSYYGLDKLSLNNIIQDNTYMKEYITYQMMNYMGVASSLCSFVYITVNGEDWGLYLAIEGVEDSFLERNYGSDTGELYKPDSMSMGGGRGNGKDFEMTESDTETDTTANSSTADSSQSQNGAGGNLSGSPPEIPSGDMGQGGESGSPPEIPSGDMGQGGESGSAPEIPSGATGGQMDGGSMGSDDVSLIYSDDSYSSYSNIFDNAKTDITDSDKDRLIASLKQLNEGTNIEEVVDVEQVIKYFTVHNFVCNFDSYTGSMIHNYYLYEKDGVLTMLPWDYNLAFGGFTSAGSATNLVNYAIDTPVSGGDVSSRPMLAWIFASEEYTELYHQYFSEFISGFFDSGEFENMITNVTALISSYVEKDPTKFCTYEEFEQGVATLQEFCTLRAESVKGQLSGEIPSTTTEQNANPTALIDASSITISDMGSMGNNMGGGMAQQGTSDSADSDASQDSSDAVTLPDSSSGGFGGTLPDGSTGGADGTPPDGSTGGFGGTPPDGSTGGFGGTRPGMQSGEAADGSASSGSTDQNGNSSDNSAAQGGGFGGNRLDMQGGGAMVDAAAGGDFSGIILLVVSILVLGAGLLLVFKFRRR